MAKIEATFVFPCIQKGYIKEALTSLIEKTPIELRTVVVDQTKDGFFSDKELWKAIEPLIDMYLRPPRNLGFAKGQNEGILHGLHWGSKYVAACNDDIVALDPRWWSGIMEQFKAYPEMLAVNPACPIEKGWGYGLGLPGHKVPDWGVAVDDNIYVKGRDGEAITLEKAQTPKGYEELLEMRKGHIEGFAGWFVIMPREAWETVGLYDERLTPGGGDDYDLIQRIYIAGGRASATMRSFMWHYWSSSKDIVHTSDEPLPLNRKPFQAVDDLYTLSPEGHNSPIYPPRENKPFNNKHKRRSSGIFVDDPR